MKKISLMGRRVIRSPLSYPEYRQLFLKSFEYIEKPEEADFLVFSCLMDMRDNVGEIKRVVTLRPDIQLVILSEEPLWDTVYSDASLSKSITFAVGDRDYPCVFLNHLTTGIFDFEQIPYFLTTSDDYFVRYAFLFTRNRAVKAKELTSLWAKAPIRAAFYAEYRDEEFFDAHFPDHEIRGLSRYRTMVAKAMQSDGVVRIGKGWGERKARQLLPDWHLDKLSALDRNCFIVSGVDNTHQWNYISEKVFDAFAVLAVPVYFAGRTHGITRIVPPESFINIHELTVEQAVEKILSFSPDAYFCEQYRAAQSRLAEMFSQPMSLVTERIRVVHEIIHEFDAL